MADPNLEMTPVGAVKETPVGERNRQLAASRGIALQNAADKMRRCAPQPEAPVNRMIEDRDPCTGPLMHPSLEATVVEQSPAKHAPPPANDAAGQHRDPDAPPPAPHNP